MDILFEAAPDVWRHILHRPIRSDVSTRCQQEHGLEFSSGESQNLEQVSPLPGLSSTLNIVLRVIYNAPALETLCAAVDALASYGVPVARHDALILAYANILPVDIYAVGHTAFYKRKGTHLRRRLSVGDSRAGAQHLDLGYHSRCHIRWC